MNNNMFEIATRTKMRFPYKGVVRVEDLWDLNVMELDTIFKTVNSQVKQVKEESLLGTRSSADKVLDMKIDIIKYIVAVKLNEEKSKVEAKGRKEKKEKILSILSTKKEEALLGKTEKELEAMLDEF